MPLADCPSHEQLSNYVVGKLPEDESSVVSQHVDECDSCVETIEMISDNTDSLIAALQQPMPDAEYASEEGFRHVVAAADKLGRDPAVLSRWRKASMLLDELPRRLIRDYKLLEKLGQGGMGTVYKAVHEQLGKIVALKVLPAHRTNDAGSNQRFQREMRAVGRLEHPHVVRATDAGEFEGTRFLVMEYIHGVDLSALVRRREPIPIADACEMVRQAAVGLEHIEEHGLVHRDIKPSNLILTSASGNTSGAQRGAVVKILDLGLARFSDQTRESKITLRRALVDIQTPESELTSSGQLMGTLDYMAPEQATDSRDVDIRADIYSLGATLYKLLTGKPLFSGKEHDTLVKKLLAVVNKEPRPIHELRPDVPADLASIVTRMLAKDPEERLATPRAVAPFASNCQLEDLLRSISTKPANASPEDPSPSSTSSHHMSAIPQARPAERDDGRRRSHWKLGLAMAFSIFIVAGVTLIIRDGEGNLKQEVALNPGDTFKIAEGSKESVDDVQELESGRPPLIVAKYVLSVGGSLIVSQDDDPPTEVIEMGQLPVDGFRIRSIDLSGNVEIQDADLAGLGQLPGLDSLRFSGNRFFSDSSLKAIGSLPVRTLFVDNVYLTDAGLQYLNTTVLEHIEMNRTLVGDAGLKYFNSAPRLVKLVVSDTNFTDQGIEHLADHPLVHLDLRGCSGISDKALQHVEDWTELETLLLTNTMITDAGLVHLNNVHRDLDLAGTSVSKEGIFKLQQTNPNVALSTDWTKEANRRAAHWVAASGGTLIAQRGMGTGYAYSRTVRETANIPSDDFRITGIALNTPELNHGIVRNLDGLEHLRRLDLSGTQLDPYHVGHIVASLKSLSLNNNPAVNDDSLSRLSNYDNLQSLELRNTKIAPACVASLKQLKNLRYIDLTGTAIPPTDIDSLQKSLPNCLVVNPFNPASNDPDRRVAHWLLGLGGIVRMIRLEESGDSTEDRRIPNKPFQIHTINFDGNPLIDDACVIRFTEFKGLKKLSLRDTRLTDTAISSLGYLTHLAELNLTGTSITAEGMETVRKRLPDCAIVGDTTGS